MNKYLVIVIGKQFVHPMFISGDEKRLFELLSTESISCDYYLYLIYKHSERNDIYVPYKRLVKGFFQDFSGYIVNGVKYEN